MAQRSKATKTKKAEAKRTGGKMVGKAKAHTKMALGRGWRLTSKEGASVSATLLAVSDLGDRYIAIFKSAV
ncbi:MULTISPECIES: hypothetical protein [unclassified Bradyrhizobium]|uniref:hypothetical protein n=1 Tax=unclassified Bradyrhizobium TaxID=2631580 RepID=UPI00230587F3|nr:MULTISPECIES: hypothetical protein [unclassified Bradyrhizobium]MDA9451158.1 hypothetical protein [Bradyrhizobium sp. CCBAU 21360]MDA9457537.1 hypothetical protein [Bradyrhizobium sp. CCBAU 21359]